MSALVILVVALAVVAIGAGAWRKRPDGSAPPVRTEIATAIMVLLVLGGIAILYFARG